MKKTKIYIYITIAIVVICLGIFGIVNLVMPRCPNDYTMSNGKCARTV